MKGGMGVRHPFLINQQRCFADVTFGFEDRDDEMRDIGAGDVPAGNTGQVRQHAVLIFRLAVTEHTGPGNGPGQRERCSAFPDQRFLPVLVVVDSLERQRPEDAVVEKAAVRPRVAGTHTRDRDEPVDTGRLHHVQYVYCPFGKQRDGLARQAHADREDDGVLIRDGLLNVGGVADITLNRRQVRMFDLHLPGLTRQDRNFVTTLQRQLDRLEPDPSAAANNKNAQRICGRFGQLRS